MRNKGAIILRKLLTFFKIEEPYCKIQILKFRSYNNDQYTLDFQWDRVNSRGVTALAKADLIKVYISCHKFAMWRLLTILISIEQKLASQKFGAVYLGLS